ncbi:ABC transporter substrate-binding protein [Ktedonobacteria bacterium brp13]|nr:ABC transporter substrate-binding protein [Ktedonobacteria bacterium brp13]
MRQFRKRTGLLSLASIFCVLAILLSACGSTTSTSNTNGSSAPAPASQQVLREPIEGGFDTLDPALTAGGLGDPQNLIYNGLVAADDQGNIHDQLAASHTVSSDGLTYTFKIRSGLKFSDGTPIDASTFAYSINRTIDPKTKSEVSTYLQLIKGYADLSSGKVPTLIGNSIIVQDPSTLVLKISKPASYFLQALNYSTSDAVNEKLINKYGTNWTQHLNEGGASGPFAVKSYNPATGLVLVPNPDFTLFKPKLQEIDYTVTSDRDATYKAFKAGQYDLAPVPPADDAVSASMPGYQSTPALATRFIGMNYLVKPLDNIKIRQALELAINKNLVVGSIIGKSVTPSDHIIPNGIPGYNPNLIGPDGVTSTAGDATKAKQLFQQGLQEEGLTLATFPHLTIAYDLSYKAGGDTITAIVNEWKQELGITIKTVPTQPNDLIDQEFATVGKAGPLQLWYATWATDYLDPQDWTTLFFDKGVSNNAFNYGQNKSSDAAQQQAVQTELEQADVNQNQAARLNVYQVAEQKLVNDVPYITTYQSSYVYVVNPKLQGWKLYPLGSMATNDWANVYFAQ